MKRFSIILALTIFVLTGCIDPPKYDEVPKIEYESMSKLRVNQGDTLSIRFTFEDGDGDIGFREGEFEEVPDSTVDFCSDDLIDNPTYNVFLVDSRTGCFEPFRVPYIEKKGSSDDISGTIKINLGAQTTYCTFDKFDACPDLTNCPVDTVFYTLQLKDRAGQLSNIITTDTLYINCIPLN